MQRDPTDIRSLNENVNMEHLKQESVAGHRDLVANLMQVAMINKMLPKGYKFELLDTIKR